MKLLHLILFLCVIIGNEVVLELALTEEQKVALLDVSIEEQTESEQMELEVESEIDYFMVDLGQSLGFEEEHKGGGARSIANVLNPYIEIHSPPPDLL